MNYLKFSQLLQQIKFRVLNYILVVPQCTAPLSTSTQEYQRQSFQPKCRLAKPEATGAFFISLTRRICTEPMACNKIVPYSTRGLTSESSREKNGQVSCSPPKSSRQTLIPICFLFSSNLSSPTVCSIDFPLSLMTVS